MGYHSRKRATGKGLLHVEETDKGFVLTACKDDLDAIEATGRFTTKRLCSFELLVTGRPKPIPLGDGESVATATARFDVAEDSLPESVDYLNRSLADVAAAIEDETGIPAADASFMLKSKFRRRL
jgi:hypothetical protein